MQQRFELIEGAVPEALLALHPGARFLKRLLSQTKPVDAALDTTLDDLRLFEHLQMA